MQAAGGGRSEAPVTVRDVWRGALPHGTELLAGGAGLERRVEWATSLRTRPPAFDAIKGGEMAFVPVRSIRLLDDRLDLAQVMASLGEKGGVAVAIVGDASSEAIAVADRMMLPLLKLPGNIPLPDIQHATVRYILDQRTQLHAKEEHLRAQLMELALGGAGVPAIVDRLAAICEVGALWQAEDGRILHRSGTIEHDAAALDEVHRWLAGVSIPAADPPVHETDATGGRRCTAPIPVRDGVGGFITAIASPPHVQLARAGVSRAASAAAIEIDRERAVLAARDDVEGDVAEALLSGSYPTTDAVAERARRVGFDVGGHHRVVCAMPGGDGRLDAAVAAVRRLASAHTAPVLVTAYAGNVCLILAHAEADAAIPAAMRGLVDTVEAAAPGRHWVAGAGRVGRGAAAVRTSHNEAVQAATMGRRLHGEGRIVEFAGLGLHRLLFSLAQNPELRAFRDDTLGALRRHDARGGGNAGLIRTLEAYFECQGSPTEMAQRLHVHRNTVLYRLRRIQEVADVDLDDPLARLRLHLSLRASDVLDVPDSH